MRIAVWNTAFLGDAVLTLPLLQSLALAFPGAEIDFYVRKGFARLFSVNPLLHNVVEYDKSSRGTSFASFFSFIKEVRVQHYDLWISPHLSPRSSLIARMSGAQQRIAYTEAAFSRFAYTDRVDRRFFQMHEVDRLLALLEPLSPSTLSSWPEIVLSESALAASRAFFDPLHGPVIGMHPGSTWETKCWPLEYFADIALRCLENSYHLVLFGAGSDEEKNQELERLLRAKASQEQLQYFHTLSNKLDLLELAAHIKKVDVYLSNDSGPMHLAWAQKVATLALFGPTVQSFGFFPLGEKARVLEKKLDCRPCGLHGHKHCPLGHHNCMRGLLPDLVWSELLSLL